MHKRAREHKSIVRIEKVYRNRRMRTVVPKYGIYILADEHDSKVFDDNGKIKMESMECTLCFVDKETKE